MSFLGLLREARETLTPIVRENGAFLKEGRLSPSEFLQAGDQLVALSPIWAWCEAAKPSISRSFLPPNKQYLVARNVVSERRVKDMERERDDEEVEDFCFPTFVAPADPSYRDDEKDTVLIFGEADEKDNSGGEEVGALSDDSERRYFTLIISYDRYYRTPRVFFNGYDRNGCALPREFLMQDVFSENASRTVTIERFQGECMASIHPCQHANAMVKITQQCVEHGLTPSVEHYLFIFLKLLHSVLPSLEIPDLMEVVVQAKRGHASP